MDADGEESARRGVGIDLFHVKHGGLVSAEHGSALFPWGRGSARRAHGAPGFTLITRGVIGIFWGNARAGVSCEKCGFLGLAAPSHYPDPLPPPTTLR